MEEQSQIQFLEKVSLAACIRSEYTILNLVQLIGYMQHVAQELLKANGERFNELSELFEYTNKQIKLLIAI